MDEVAWVSRQRRGTGLGMRSLLFPAAGEGGGEVGGSGVRIEDT